MSNDSLTKAGLSNGRSWSALLDDEAPVAWVVDPDQGYIQGPLDLEFLRGKRLALNLAEGQQALLLNDNQLQAVYLDGNHFLEVGTGIQHIDPACRLIFLASREPLKLHWNRQSPLQWGTQDQQTLIGSCDLQIEWPSRFFRAFLQGQEELAGEKTTQLIDEKVRSIFAELLSASLGLDGAPTASETQARLTRLEPDDLNEELNACGLSCTHLAVYTAVPPIEEYAPTAALDNSPA